MHGQRVGVGKSCVCGLTSSIWIGPHLSEKFREAVDFCKKTGIPR